MHDFDDEHYHDHEHDHHHDDEVFDDGTAVDSILYKMENIELKSVGIDIGSSGTQVIFSLLKLRRAAKDLSSRYVIVSKENIYRSPVELTPYTSEERIDEQAIAEMIKNAYEDAGIRAEEVDTGAVILTGEAIRRHNARAIADVLADQGGQFVCASAGHNMEALLAAYGSGAAYQSYERECRILNIDIGGGTTKLAVVENGKVLETAAIYIGGRLLVVDEDNRITRLDPGGVYIAEQIGLSLNIGDIIEPNQLERMADWMSQAILQAILQRPMSPEVEKLYLTDPLLQTDRIDGVMFSGGVGEYVYAKENRYFGDLGKYLGNALLIKGAQGGFPWPLLPAGECIRATVVGASEYSVQVSGNTHFITNDSLLPRKNLQVLKPAYELRGPIDAERVAQAIQEHFQVFDLNEGESDVALAFQWYGEPSYERIASLAKGVRTGLPVTIGNKQPIYVILDGDIARTLGSIMKEEFQVESDILSIDGITLQDFDFIDIGRKLEPSGTVPVTVKSLVFQL